MTTTITAGSIQYVRDETVDLGAPCPECSDMDAFVVVNIYIREFGQCVRMYEACVNCGRRILLEESGDDIVVEIPASLRADVERNLA